MAASTAPNVTPVMSSWDKVPSLKPARKKGNPLFLVALAGIVLLGASGLWRASHTAPAMPMVKVVSAARDIPAGVRLGFMAVRYLDVPRKLATPDMVTSLGDINGRVARTFLKVGEPIQAWMLFSDRGGLAMNLETHERALTLQLNDDTIVDHSIQPDDVVDIIAISTKDGKKYTKTIAQAARVVMAVPKEQMLSRAAGAASNMITLAVTPDMAEAITEATEAGKIRLLLRNRLSRVQQHLAGATPDDILPLSALQDEKARLKAPLAMAVPPPPPPSKSELNPQSFAPPPVFAPQNRGPLEWIVEVFSGGHKESVSVPER
jgi:Flp pilus assembly protein CpaB